MRKLIIAVLVLISLDSFAQPTNYTWYKQRIRQYSLMLDSMLYIPRYNGTPSGVRANENSAIDGAIAVDTANGRQYFYYNGSWRRLANYSELGVDSIWREAGKDSIFYSKAGSTYKIKDSTGGGGSSSAGNYGNVQLNRNGVLATPGSDSLDFDGGLSIKGSLKVTDVQSGTTSDSAVLYNNSTKLFTKKAAAFINTASRDSGDIIQWNGTTHVYVPKPTAATNLIGHTEFRVDITTNAPEAGDSTVTNTGWINKYLFVWRNGKRLDSLSTRGYTFNKSTGVLTVHPPWSANDSMIIDAYDTASIYNIALEEIVLPSVDLSLAANRSNLTKTGTVFTPTANNTSFDAYGQDALIIPSGQSGRFYSQYVTSGDNTYMLFVNTSSSFLPYSDANSHGLYVNGSNQIQPLNSGTPGSSVGSVTAGSWYGIYRDIGAGNIRIQSSTDGVSWSDVATLSAYSSADLYLSIVIYSTSGKKVSNPKGQGVQ